MTDVIIVDSGVANLASITSAFRRLGARVAVTGESAAVRDAPRMVLPGVGAFGAGVGSLRARGLDSVIAAAVMRGTPVLGVCLGMQMLCEGSEESPGVAGLGLVAGTCRRLPEHVRVPHLGWNTVTAESGGTVASGVAAFANSYPLRTAPPPAPPPPPGRAAASGPPGGRVRAAAAGGRPPGVPVPPRAAGGARAGLLGCWGCGRA